MKDFLEARFNQRGLERQEYLSNFVRRYDIDNSESTKEILNKLLNNDILLKNGYDSQNVATELLTRSWYSLDYELSYQGDSFKNMSEGKQAFVILKLLLDFIPVIGQFSTYEIKSELRFAFYPVTKGFAVTFNASVEM